MKTLTKTLFIFFLVFQVCFTQNFWKKVGDMPEIRYAHSVNELNGKVYIVGGANSEGSAFPKNTFILNLSTDEWTQISLFNNRVRQMHQSCIIGEKIYVMGGNDGFQTIATMEVLDPKTNKWTSRASMITDKGLAGCVSFEGKIYVMGGIRGQLAAPDWSGLKTVEVYDSSSNSWSSLASMPTKRWGCSAEIFNGKIYVFGGVSFSPAATVYKSVEVYDIEHDTWDTTTQLSPMPTPRYCLTTCLLDSNIYAIGGWRHSSFGPIYDKVEVYNPQNDKWHTEKSLPIPMCAASVVYDEKIYLYGGTHTTHPNIGFDDIYEFSNRDITDVKTTTELPRDYILEQNYPNPFNPSTTICYRIPALVSSEKLAPTLAGAKVNNVTLKIYDILGREIATLVNKNQNPGKYEVEWIGTNMPSGIYFYKLSTSDYAETKKMVLLR